MVKETLITIALTSLTTLCATLLAFYLQWRYTERINQIRYNLSSLILFKTILEHDLSVIVPIINEKQLSEDETIKPFIPLNISTPIAEFGNTLCLIPTLGPRLCRHLLYREYLATLVSGMTKNDLSIYIKQESALIADIEAAITAERQLEKESFLVAVYRGTFDARRY